MAQSRNILNLWGLLPTRERPNTQTDIALAGGAPRSLSFLASRSKEIDRLVTLLEKCNTTSRIDPKDWADLSRLMMDRMPLVKRAVTIHQDMVGRPEIDDESELSDQTRSLAESYIESVPLLSEQMPEEPTGRGLNNVARAMLKDCLIEGMSFWEERFAVYDGEVSEDYRGLMTFDPQNWSYEYMPEKRAMALTYINYHKPNYIGGEYVHNPYFHAVKLASDHGNPWGVPLLRGGVMIFRVFASLLLCIELQGKRFGNPPTLTLLTGQDPGKFQDPKQQKLYFDLLEKLRGYIEDAWQYVYQGQAADVVAAMPGDHQVLSRTLGAEIDNWVDPDMLWKITILASSVLNVPPALLNVNDTGGGLNSDMFKQHYKLLKATAQSNRNALRPTLEAMLCNFLLNQGVAPAEAERVSISFEGVNLDDKQELANIEKTEAETMAQKLENYATMQAISAPLTEEYGREHGFI